MSWPRCRGGEGGSKILSDIFETRNLLLVVRYHSFMRAYVLRALRFRLEIPIGIHVDPVLQRECCYG